jgi:hypothetical protein
VSVRWKTTGRDRRGGLALVMASIALLPALAACSSSSSIEYATDAFPNQSLADILKGATASPTPAAAPPAPNPALAASGPGSTAAPAMAAAPAPAPVAAPAPASVAAAPPPTPSAPPAESDPVADAFPSVSLVDILTGKAGSR